MRSMMVVLMLVMFLVCLGCQIEAFDARCGMTFERFALEVPDGLLTE